MLSGLSLLSRSIVHVVVPAEVQGVLYRKRFFRTNVWLNRHFGKFESFAQASAYARRYGSNLVYSLDHRAWLKERHQLYQHDYPVLLRLSQMLTEIGPDVHVADVGGSVGVCWYVYSQQVPMPRVRWTVCELPDAVEAGRLIASERGERHLEFTTDLIAAIDGADVLLGAGALQFIEATLADILLRVRHRPRFLLINRIPLTRVAGSGFVTLHNTGLSVSPCRVDDEPSFVASIESLGYRLVDSWQCQGNTLDVPLHDECRLDAFRGFYFRA